MDTLAHTTLTTTPMLEMMLEEWRDTMPRAKFIELSTKIVARMQNHLVEIESAKKKPGFVKKALLQVDEKIEADRKRSPQKINCKEGCAGCCHLQVWVSVPEAELLAKAILGGEVVIDRNLLQAQAERMPMLDQDWFRLPLRANRCVFLGNDNRCQVYKKRPINCRKLLVVTDPRNCSNDYVTGEPKQVGTLRSAESEVFASAFYDHFPTAPMRECYWQNFRRLSVSSVNRKTDEEIELLARDIHDQKVFTSLMVDRPTDIPKVFPLERNDLTSDVAMFYEYLDRKVAQPHPNLPIFATVRFLDATDMIKVLQQVEELKAHD